MVEIQNKDNYEGENMKEEVFIFRIWLKILNKAFKQTTKNKTFHTRPEIASSKLRVYKLLHDVTKLTPDEEQDEELAKWEVQACETLSIFSSKMYEVYNDDDAKLNKDDSFRELLKLRKRSFMCRSVEGFQEIMVETLYAADRFMNKDFVKKFEREKSQREAIEEEFEDYD